jgi:alanine racemase
MFPDASILSWCEVSTASLQGNIADFKNRLNSNTRLGVVVKSNAYGHGLINCAQILQTVGADWLIVNSVDEAHTIRRAAIDLPIYLCGPMSAAQASLAVDARLRVGLYDRDVLEALAQAGRAAGWSVPVHLKLETGTYRQGLELPALIDLAKHAQSLQGIAVEGLTTHYADIEDTTDHTFAMDQLAQLNEAQIMLQQNGVQLPMVHSANSAATMLWPDTHGDLVRVGIAAYGLWPSRETYATALQRAADLESGYQLPNLSPVLSWRTRIMQVKNVPAGSYVGYGRTYRTTHPMRLAVLPVGYHEGYRRALSNAAHVLIHGVCAPVRGRVCMNMTMVDVTHIPEAEVNDHVTLMGTDGEEHIHAEQLAEWMGTIHYEMIATINADQPRFLVGQI